MLNALIAWSVRNRLLVVAASLLLVVVGTIVGQRIPVDVFPDLTAPTVTVVTEAPGLAPEEVETLVTWPIETAVNGASGVRRVRSASGVGISIVWVEFAWGTDLRGARQIVNEKLQVAAPQLPADIPPPQMAPTSSVMGEILFLSLGWEGDDEVDAMAARTVADQVLRRRLLGVPGVSQVVPIGGGVKQVQVRLRPEALAGLDVTFEQVAEAIRIGNGNASGGFVSADAPSTPTRSVTRSSRCATGVRSSSDSSVTWSSRPRSSAAKARPTAVRPWSWASSSSRTPTPWRSPRASTRCSTRWRPSYPPV
jgi:Cu/Ag efflux pump CusA